MSLLRSSRSFRRLLLVNLVLFTVAMATSTMATALHAAITPEDAQKLRQAQTAFDGKKYQQALGLLQPLMKKYPEEGEFFRLAAHSFYELKQFPQARIAAVQAMEKGRITSDLLARVVQIDRQNGDKVAAANTVRLLTVIDKNQFTWRMLYAELLSESESLQAAVGVYRQLMAERPDSAAIMLQYGNLMMKLERYPEAVTNLETAWHLGQNDPRIAKALAEIHQRNGRTSQALAWYQRVVDLANRPDELVLLKIARLQWDAGQVAKARATATKLLGATKVPTTKAETLVLLGQLALHENQASAAMAYWRQAIAAGSKSQKLLLAVGAYHYNQGDYPVAAKLLKQALPASDQPVTASDSQPLRFLIISLIKQGSRDEARGYLRQYIELAGLSDEAKQLVRMWTKSK